jgi:hypothetical protein
MKEKLDGVEQEEPKFVFSVSELDDWRRQMAGHFGVRRNKKKGKQGDVMKGIHYG